MWRRPMGMIRTCRVVLNSFKSESTLSGRVRSCDKRRRTGKTGVGPHVAAHEIFGSKRLQTGSDKAAHEWTEVGYELIARVPRLGEC